MEGDVDVYTDVDEEAVFAIDDWMVDGLVAETTEMLMLGVAETDEYESMLETVAVWLSVCKELEAGEADAPMMTFPRVCVEDGIDIVERVVSPT